MVDEAFGPPAPPKIVNTGNSGFSIIDDLLNKVTGTLKQGVDVFSQVWTAEQLAKITDLQTQGAKLAEEQITGGQPPQTVYLPTPQPVSSNINIPLLIGGAAAILAGILLLRK